MEPLIADWLAHHARTRGEHVACVDLGAGRWFTYRQFFDRVARLAGAFRGRHGVGPGDRVMVVARNSTDLFEIMFAAWRIGAVFMPVDWELDPPELGEIAVDGSPALVVVDEEFLPALPTTARRILTRRPGDETSEYECDIATSDPIREFSETTLDTMNTLLYTWGTTGKPKGVIGTWRMTTAMLLQASANAMLTSDSVGLVLAPQSQPAGLHAFATALFHAGGTVAAMADWDPSRALRHLADPTLGVTHTHGGPDQFQLMSRVPGVGDLTFPTLRVAGVSGGPIPADLMEGCAAHGLSLTPSYGLTEAFGVTHMSAESALRKPGASGWPTMYTEVRIADGNDAVVPAGAIGEIQIKSGAVTPGYWRRPETTAAAFVDGWFRTGDLGAMDETGLLYVAGRKPEEAVAPAAEQEAESAV